jgi:hypothetical protein
VKRQLAAEVGPSTAAEVYWQLGRRVVAAVTVSGLRTVVWYDPPDEAAFVREWLEGLGRVELRPQTGGPLSRRVERAITRHYAEGARRIVIIGSDYPGLDQQIVAGGFAALEKHDLVLGPTLDGFAYLIGVRQPQPALFRDIAWDRPGVAPRLLARAKALGLSLRLLPPLRSVTTARDARLVGLLKP